MYKFQDVPQEAGLWENISLCSDVMEGAWYLLYDNKKKPSRQRPSGNLFQKVLTVFIVHL